MIGGKNGEIMKDTRLNYTLNVVSRWVVGLVFLFSSFVGMFFGFYPAYRASKLNPIDCLRYE